MPLKLDALSDKEKRVWTMRYRYGWLQTRIAREMGMTQGGVSKMLIRAQARLGLPAGRVTVFGTKPRRVRPIQLSLCGEI